MPSTAYEKRSGGRRVGVVRLAEGEHQPIGPGEERRGLDHVEDLQVAQAELAQAGDVVGLATGGVCARATASSTTACQRSSKPKSAYRARRPRAAGDRCRRRACSTGRPGGRGRTCSRCSRSGATSPRRPARARRAARRPACRRCRGRWRSARSARRRRARAGGSTASCRVAVEGGGLLRGGVGQLDRVEPGRPGQLLDGECRRALERRARAGRSWPVADPPPDADEGVAGGVLRGHLARGGRCRSTIRRHQEAQRCQHPHLEADEGDQLRQHDDLGGGESGIGERLQVLGAGLDRPGGKQVGVAQDRQEARRHRAARLRSSVRGGLGDLPAPASVSRWR